jgi:hypothetical protein
MRVERELRAQEARERQAIQEEAARQARRAERAEHIAAVVSTVDANGWRRLGEGRAVKVKWIVSRGWGPDGAAV